MHPWWELQVEHEREQDEEDGFGSSSGSSYAFPPLDMHVVNAASSSSLASPVSPAPSPPASPTYKGGACIPSPHPLEAEPWATLLALGERDGGQGGLGEFLQARCVNFFVGVLFFGVVPTHIDPTLSHTYIHSIGPHIHTGSWPPWRSRARPCASSSSTRATSASRPTSRPASCASSVRMLGVGVDVKVKVHV